MTAGSSPIPGREAPWKTSEYWAAVNAGVAAAPPFTPEIRDKLHVLLAPMREALTNNRRAA